MTKLITPPSEQPQTVLGYPDRPTRRASGTRPARRSATSGPQGNLDRTVPLGSRRSTTTARSTTGRSTTGRSTTGRSTSGRSTPGRVGSGRSGAGRGTAPGGRPGVGAPAPSARRAAAAAAAVAARPATRTNLVARLVHRAADGAGDLAIGLAEGAARLGALVAPGGPPAGPDDRRRGQAGGRRAGEGSRRGTGGGHRSGLAIDPRFRERWVAVRRQEGYRRLRLIVLLGAVLALVGAGMGALHTPWLSARTVHITASPHVPEAEIAELSRLEQHPPMIDVDAGAISRRLEALPWVASASVSRSWPSTVAVSVTERRPVAQVPGAGGAVLVDATGRVLGPAPAPGSRTPTVPALAAAPAAPAAGRWLPGTGGRTPAGGHLGVALAAAAALPTGVAAQVATITVAPSGDVTLALGDGVTVVDLGVVGAAPPGSVAAAGLSRQAAALAALGSATDLSTIARVDLTVPDHPALTPKQPAGNVSTASAG